MRLAVVFGLFFPVLEVLNFDSDSCLAFFEFANSVDEASVLLRDEVVERRLSSFGGYAGGIPAPLQIKSPLLP